MNVIDQSAGPALCAKGDFKVAVRHVRSSEFCRDHLRSEVLDNVELLTATVTGVSAVTDAYSNESVAPGGTVRLDPAETHIGALVAAGAVEVIVPAPAKDAPAESRRGRTGK